MSEQAKAKAAAVEAQRALLEAQAALLREEIRSARGPMYKGSKETGPMPLLDWCEYRIAHFQAIYEQEKAKVAKSLDSKKKRLAAIEAKLAG